MVDLPAADVGHDAIGAGIVATAHHGNESGELVADGGNGILEIFVGLPAKQQIVHDRAEIQNRLGSDHQVDVWKAIFQVLLCPFGRATGNDQLATRLLRFPFLQSADFRKGPFLGMVSHRAGIYEQQLGLVLILRRDQSFRPEVTRHFVGVRHIHLAPIRAHVVLHKRPIICSLAESGVPQKKPKMRLSPCMLSSF